MSAPGKRFRIAFSFAGEKRLYVEEVADLLAQRFGKEAILYDKFHEAEFARHDLGIYLPKLYGEQSELIVPVLCPHYDPKRWTGWEWLHIYGLLTQADGHRVMPSRFEHANADGLSPTAGFIELDDKAPAEAAVLILERLALNEGNPRDTYLPTAPPVSSPLKSSIPNNLPRLQSFFGREKELAAIREALDPESRTWGALIDGPGGMGKTSLAVRAAYDIPAGRFQRIVFVSVKDREMDDDGARPISGALVPAFLEMLTEIAREIALPDLAKAPEDQRIRLLLEALRPTQTLLLLDNLEALPKTDRDHLFTFVKRLPQGCKAILTSRRRMGSSADTLILEKLELAPALEILDDLARRNPLLARTSPAERTALYQQTGGKPLLLRWVAGQLGRGSCRTFTDALHFLTTCPPDNDPLEFIFGDLAREFTEPETKVLCALTYFALPATVEHIRQLAEPLSEAEEKRLERVSKLGEIASRLPAPPAEPAQPLLLSAEQVDTALASLANRSLVIPDQEETVFSLVPMVAEFLRRARPEVVQETGNSLQKRAYALIVENGYKKHERFPVLDAAWPTLSPALPLFLAGSNARLQTVCDALEVFLNFTGRWDEWLSLSGRAEAKALSAGDHWNAGWNACRAGGTYSLRQQADPLLACADRAAEHWKRAQAGDHERAVAVELRGFGHRLKRDYPAAVAAFQEALELHRSCGPESRDVASALNSLAGAERLSGDSAGAERDYREALRVARAVDNAEGVATYTGNLALLALDRKDWLGAEALAREALPLSEALGRQELIAADCRYLAQALVRQGKAADALPHARRGVEIYTRLGSPDLKVALATLRECEA